MFNIMWYNCFGNFKYVIYGFFVLYQEDTMDTLEYKEKVRVLISW